MTDWVERVWGRWGAEIFVLVGIVVTLALLTDGFDCGSGDQDGTGVIVDDAEIERRIESAIRDQQGDDLTINCPDEGIEAGTDFSCGGVHNEFEDARVYLETHLDSDGETIEPFDLEPVWPDP